MVRGSQLSQLKYGWIGFKTKIWRAEARQILRRWLTMVESQTKVEKVSHAIASEGTSKNWHFDFSDVAISIENSQNFTGWALVGPAIYMGFCWIPQFLPTIQSIINVKTEPLNYPTRIQRFEIAEIELSQVFSTESNGSYPLQSAPLRTLPRSAFKCRMAPKLCASFEIRIGPTWSNCQKMSKAWIVFKICWNVSSPKYWSMISDVFLFIIFTVLTRYVWFEIWWSLVGKLPASQEDPTTMF